MVSILIDIINKIVNLIITQIEADKQQLSQGERDEVEHDPNAFFSRHFNRVSKPSSKDTSSN